MFIRFRKLKNKCIHLNSKSNYYHRIITKKEKYLFKDLVDSYEKIKNIQSRDSKIKILSEFFYKILLNEPSDLNPSLYLTSSTLGPLSDNKEMGFSDHSLLPVLEQLSLGEYSKDDIIRKYKELGDFGDVTYEIFKMKPLKNTGDFITISDVYNVLCTIAKINGSGSVIRKQEEAIKLIKKCRTIHEVVYIIKFLANRQLNIGIGEKNLLSAMAQSFVLLYNKNAASCDKKKIQLYNAAVSMAYAQRPIFSDLTEMLSSICNDSCGIEEITKQIVNNMSPKLGIPIQTMGASAISEITQATKRMKDMKINKLACEYKYDGERVQVHMDKKSDQGKIFSRNLQLVEERFITLVSSLNLSVKEGIDNFIVEGEVVAIDKNNQKLPFQALQTKENKYFCFYLFDLLYINGKSLIKVPFDRRRSVLRSSFTPVKNIVEFVYSEDVHLSESHDIENNFEKNPFLVDEKIYQILRNAVLYNTEGLIVKALDGESYYEPGKRGYLWLKLKHDYIQQRKTHELSDTSPSLDSGTFVPDTLDLVPIGAYYGKGRRKGLYGSFLMACYNKNQQNYETICKLGTGFNDVNLSEITRRLKQLELSVAHPSYVTCHKKNNQPDVWLLPTEVWEVKGAQLTTSKVYKTGWKGLSDSGRNQSIDRKTMENFSQQESFISRGLGLRFPRFLRLRPDKKPETASGRDQLVKWYRCTETTI